MMTLGRLVPWLVAAFVVVQTALLVFAPHRTGDPVSFYFALTAGRVVGALHDPFNWLLIVLAALAGWHRASWWRFAALVLGFTAAITVVLVPWWREAGLTYGPSRVATLLWVYTVIAILPYWAFGQIRRFSDRATDRN